MQAAGPLGQPLARYYAAWRAYLTSKPGHTAALGESLPELESLVKAQPNWAEAVALRLLTEHRLGHLDEAVLDYETAVQLGERRLFGSSSN